MLVWGSAWCLHIDAFDDEILSSHFSPVCSHLLEKWLYKLKKSLLEIATKYKNFLSTQGDGEMYPICRDATEKVVCGIQYDKRCDHRSASRIFSFSASVISYAPIECGQSGWCRNGGRINLFFLRLGENHNNYNKITKPYAKQRGKKTCANFSHLNSLQSSCCRAPWEMRGCVCVCKNHFFSEFVLARISYHVYEMLSHWAETGEDHWEEVWVDETCVGWAAVVVWGQSFVNVAKWATYRGLCSFLW